MRREVQFQCWQKRFKTSKRLLKTMILEGLEQISYNLFKNVHSLICKMRRVTGLTSWELWELHTMICAGTRAPGQCPQESAVSTVTRAAAVPAAAAELKLPSLSS